MLDNITKKNIDDCRDVLVGKVPDPKSQIEQITLALIYKFMDDMDKEAVDKFKGKAKFFTGEYSKFGWRKLFDPSLGGAEMLRLYREALEKLNTNPNIPNLFRDIFKDASLPYNDPSTLKLFLKYINEFSYDHSEKLGDAFEYLLSILGSQGDAGQFRTPRHVIEFIVKCVNPQKNETVLDPATGTAGFLLSAYKHIINQNTDKRQGDKLTPDQRKKLGNNFVGYDISPDMVRLSLANMYLHGFTTPNIEEYDTLSSEDKWNETFDVILANPPFMTPKGGIRPHKKFGVQANKSEVLFCDYIAEHLNNNGRAGIIVPNGIVATTQNAYKQLRKLLIDNGLIAVVSLPAGCFNPYSGVKTSVLFLDRQLAKKSNHILFIKVGNDGFDLGAQRREHDKNDLPLAWEAFEAYKQSINTGKSFDDAKYNSIALLVEKEKVLKNKDIVLSGDRYIAGKVAQTEFESISINDVVGFKRGTSITSKNLIEGNVPVIAGGQKPAYYHNVHNREAGSITISSSGAYAGFVAFHPNPIFASDCFTPFSKDKEKLSNKFLFYLFKGRQDEIYELQEGGGQPHIYPKHFDNWEIPLPPIEIQQQIVSEIEAYQKVIDGAKMVVDNYKPTISINPEWEMVDLGDVSDFKNGLNYNNDDNIGIPIKIVGVGDFKDYLSPKIENLKSVNIPEKISDELILRKEDLLFVRSNGNKELVGRCIIIPSLSQKISFTGFSIRLRFNDKRCLPIFYCHMFRTDFFRKILSGNEGANISNISQERLRELTIPLPSMEEQQQIVKSIEKEQKLVESNKELIKLFEQKIKTKINEVWGVKEEIEA